MIIYVAGSLFTEGERAWLAGLRDQILASAAQFGAEVHVTLPQELISDAEIAQLGDLAGREIFSRCVTGLDRADILIAVLDGAMVDDGTAWELGYFFGRRNPDTQPIIGIRTDFRLAGEIQGTTVNVMLEYACDQIFHSREDILSYLQNVFFL